MTEVADADDIQVKQSLTDVLTRMDGRIDSGFTEMRTLIGDKASQSDLAAIRRDLDHYQKDTNGRLLTLEDARRVKEGERRSMRNVGVVTAGALTAAGAIAGIIYTIAYVVHG